MTESVNSYHCWECPLFYDGVCNSDTFCADCEEFCEREDEEKSQQN